MVAESKRVEMRVSATLREVVVAQQLAPALGHDAARGFDADLLWRAVNQHTNYLLPRLRVLADGRLLSFRVTHVLPQENAGGADSRAPLYLDETRVRYDLEAPLPPGEPVAELSFSHQMLADLPYAPGVAWQPHYVLRVKLGDRQERFNGVLRLGAEIRVPLPKPSAAAAAESHLATNEVAAALSSPVVQRAFAVTSYLDLGVHHILGGWDHLLFLVALTLAAAGWWDLFKLIATFTLAHSLTVTLAVLHWVQMPQWFVEPVIAGSIVFVAVENNFWPERARTKERLLVAFGFGLVHGLGFAGGLKGAVEDVTGGELAMAVVAFCGGVELGNLAIGLPLLCGLRWIQRWRPGFISRRVLPIASILVALGGGWFLLVALQKCL